MKTLLIITTAFALIVLTSCHKSGCTNRDAINFDVTADKDDGSCIVCNSTETKIDTESAFLKDKKFGSIHYNQNVAKFYFDELQITPNNRVCGKETGIITLTIKSLVNQNMFLYYRAYALNGPLYINISKQITINANDSINLGLVQSLNNPPFLPISLDSIVVETQNDIIYF